MNEQKGRPCQGGQSSSNSDAVKPSEVGNPLVNKNTRGHCRIFVMRTTRQGGQ